MREIEVFLCLRYSGQVGSNVQAGRNHMSLLCMTAMKIQVWSLALKVNFPKVDVSGSSMFLAA